MLLTSLAASKASINSNRGSRRAEPNGLARYSFRLSSKAPTPLVLLVRSLQNKYGAMSSVRRSIVRIIELAFIHRKTAATNTTR